MFSFLKKKIFKTETGQVDVDNEVRPEVQADAIPAPVQPQPVSPVVPALPVASPAAPVVTEPLVVAPEAAPVQTPVPAAPPAAILTAEAAPAAPAAASVPDFEIATPKAPVQEVPEALSAPQAPVVDHRPADVTVPVPAVEPVVVAPPPLVTPAPAVSAPIAIKPVPVPPAPPPTPAAKANWLNRLKTGLSRTGQNFTSLFVGVKVDEALFEDLETALIMADTGVDAATSLLKSLRARVKQERIEDGDRVKVVLREVLAAHLRPLEKSFDLDRASPVVTMLAGVNGAGKTTSIGKLARTFLMQGKSVLLAAGDTFRAAAREQLVEWGARNNVTVIAQDGGDPAAVAFDAVQSGRARGMGVVMVDTAGRLPTQLHLMEEIKKIKRVIAKADPTAPHEVLLVIDGNTGQNALAQIKAFDAAIGLTGLIVTKLDGTAKGGILAAVAAGAQGVRPIPVYWIGVGEGIEDLQPFVADEFAGAVLGL